MSFILEKLQVKFDKNDKNATIQNNKYLLFTFLYNKRKTDLRSCSRKDIDINLIKFIRNIICNKIKGNFQFISDI